MDTKECFCFDEDRYITAADLADDLFGYVGEYYCGQVKKCTGGFILTDINGKVYEVSVKERA